MAAVYWFLQDGFNIRIDLVDAIYFATVTQTTLGYGDILPTKPLTKCIVCMHSLLSLYYNVFELIDPNKTRLLTSE